MSFVRGIRGAITVKNNELGDIIEATKELLKKIQEKNKLNIEDINSIIFSVTNDLNAVFPAQAAREMGWNSVPLLCTMEIPVPGSLKKCIRILMQVNTDREQAEMVPVYLRDAVKLRPEHNGEQQ